MNKLLLCYVFAMPYVDCIRSGHSEESSSGSGTIIDYIFFFTNREPLHVVVQVGCLIKLKPPLNCFSKNQFLNKSAKWYLSVYLFDCEQAKVLACQEKFSTCLHKDQFIWPSGQVAASWNNCSLAFCHWETACAQTPHHMHNISPLIYNWSVTCQLHGEDTCQHLVSDGTFILPIYSVQTSHSVTSREFPAVDTFQSSCELLDDC